MEQLRLPESSGINNPRRTSFNLEEIKVRWKKVALENCPGVSCVTTPAFTCGTSTISDIDGNSYNTVSIGTQCWTNQNLKVTRYNDGTIIPFDNLGGPVGTTGSWAVSTGARAIYENDDPTTGTNLKTYGYLYNWFAATESKKICPTGWHVPADAEWTILIKYIDPSASSTAIAQSTNAGGSLKAISAPWVSSAGTDDYDFSALPAGQRWDDGTYVYRGTQATFWSTTEDVNGKALYRALVNNANGIYRLETDYYTGFGKSAGASVRCLRD
jgi:uncharacterized protein (TIGR02145 family)